MKKIEIKQVNTKQILLNSKINKLFKNIYLQNLNFNNSISLCPQYEQYSPFNGCSQFLHFLFFIIT